MHFESCILNCCCFHPLAVARSPAPDSDRRRPVCTRTISRCGPVAFFMHCAYALIVSNNKSYEQSEGQAGLPLRMYAIQQVKEVGTTTTTCRRREEEILSFCCFCAFMLFKITTKSIPHIGIHFEPVCSRYILGEATGIPK
jgi:hypothetical protein